MSALRWNIRSGTPYLSTGQSFCDICKTGIRVGDLAYRAELWTDTGETSYLAEIHEQCSTAQPLPTSSTPATDLWRAPECVHGGIPDTCPACRRADSAETVWMTTFGFRYHLSPHCGSLLAGQKGALAAGKTENPIFEITLDVASGFGAKQCGTCYRSTKGSR